MNNINKIFENNHHFQEADFGDIHDFYASILSTTLNILKEEQKKDPNFDNYKYCIINGAENRKIVIPDFLKTKTETVEKRKKFLGFTIKKWTETIDKKSILFVQSPLLLNFETPFNWLSEIEQILIIVPISKNGIDLVRNPDVSDASSFEEQYITSYNLSNAYGWVIRETCALDENNKLIAPILALNLGDTVYDTEKKKFIRWDYKKHSINSHESESVISHELMHLYDTYKILMNKKDRNMSNSDKLNKTDIRYLKLDSSIGDKNFIKRFNNIAYQLDDTEINAHNNELFANLSRYLDDKFTNKIINSKLANELAVELKNAKIFSDVSIFCNTSNEEIKEKIKAENIRKIIVFERFKSIYNHLEKFKNNNKILEPFLNAVKLYYKKRAVKVYNKRLSILYEVIKIHNKDIDSSKIHENYGYPAIMNTGSNSSSALNIMGYQYQLLPLNDYYQQKPNKDPGNWQYIHIGSEIKSYTKGSEPREIKGRIVRMDKNELGEYSKIYVLEENETKIVEIDIDRISLVSHYHPKRIYKKN